MKKIGLYILFFICGFEGYGQDCLTPELAPGFGKVILNSINNLSRARITANSQENEIKWIALQPWVVEKDGTLAISNTNINTFIINLNQHFATAKIQFYTLPINVIDANLYTTKDVWDVYRLDVEQNIFGQNSLTYSTEALNIYFVNSFTDEFNNITKTAGLAPYSVSKIIDNNYNVIGSDGKSIFNSPICNSVYVVGSSIQSGSSIVTHEIGHYFGLFHTFQNSTFKSERDNAIAGGDLISDTNIDLNGAIVLNNNNGYYYAVKPETKSCDFNEISLAKNATSPPGSTYLNSQFYSNKSDFNVFDQADLTASESLTEPKFSSPPINNIMSYFTISTLGVKLCSHQNGEFTEGQVNRIKAFLAHRQAPLTDTYNIFKSVPKLTNLVVTYINGKSKLNWNNNGNVLSGVVIERAIGNGVSSPTDNAFEKIAELVPGVYTFTDQASNYGTLAFYRVRISGSTEYSNIVPEVSSILPPTISANKTSINAGQSVELSAAGCDSGIIYWSNGMQGFTVYVNPQENTAYTAFCGINGFYSQPSNAIIIAVTYASTLANAEYFIDTDPGIGLATALSGIPSSGVINQTIPINLASLNLQQGVHSIGIRVKDQNNKWSLTHTKTFLVLGTSSGGTNSIADVEYFIDSLKQDRSNLVSTGISSVNDALIPVPVVQNIPQGVHSISFRVKDNQGKYSLFHTKTYLVLGSGVGGSALSKVEYFFDADPGFGNGTQVDYSAAVGEAQVIDINVNGLTTGVHVLNVRVKNLANQWSLTHAKVFLIMPNMGGNATISRVEYFIGNTDPGQGSGTSVSFSPNPDGSNVVSSFDINLSNYQAGLVRISARVKDSENRWSPIVSKTVEFLPNIAIVKLPESSIYEPSYNVLQQSIVHRYYQVRKATDNNQPLAGVILKYKLSNRPNDVYESSVSDAKGLVDLKIPIGGSNQLITNDDIIPAGVSNVGVSFDAAVSSNKSLNVSSNMFNTNDFTISTYATQQPEDKEYGVATGIGASIGVTKGVKFQLGPIEGEAGLASASVGATYGGIVTIKPDLSNQDVWEVAINGTSDYEAEISLGPKIELEATNVISVDGGINLNASILSGKRNEHVYNIDLNQYRELYYTAYKILLMKSNLSDDRLLRAANFFKRMSENYSQTPLTLVSKGKMSSIGLNASLNSNIGISSSIAKNSNISAGIEFGAEVSGELALESKNSIDIATNEDINEGSVSMGVSASAGYSASLGYDLGQDREANFSAPTPLYFSSSESITLGFERKTLNNLLKGFSTSFESNKSLSLAGITYEVDYTNEIELNTNLSQAVSNYYRTNSNVNNLFGKFLSHGKFGFVSMQNGFSSNNNFYNQFVNFSKKVGELTTSSQGNKPFIHRLSRTYTNKFGGEFEFSVALGIELGLNLNLEAWSSHTSTLTEYIYLPSVQKIAKTVDRPLNDSFITLPTQNPFEIFFDRVKTRLLQESSSAIQLAYDGFVQKVFEPISTSLTKLYSNLGLNQLALSGEKLNKPTDIKNLSSSNSPSVLTFSVPPAPSTFNTGTEVRFSYYYPENKLKTPIGVDTFQIVSDVFYLNAIDGPNRLSTVPNGNFTVSTNFSTYDLSRASLPLGSMVKLVFKQEGTNNWIVIGDVNTSISYNKLGVFAIAAKLQTDRISPEITITGPTNSQNYFTVTLAENQSGINWTNTSFSVNGAAVNFVRTGTTNTFTVPIITIPTPVDGVYRITVNTSDLAYNTSVKYWKYPCESNLTINSVTSNVPVTQKVSGTINVNAFVPENSILSLQAGKAIVFGPGFEMKDGKTMKAEVKGCDN